MALLVLVRHGQSQWNLENRFTGWVDVPLSRAGREEARAAGRKLAGYRFDEAHTSKLSRAKETLAIMMEAGGLSGFPIFEDEALNERHYGYLQGLNKADTARRFGEEQLLIWRRSYDVAPPGGESLKDTAARAVPYFEVKIAPHLAKGKHVLVVAHGNSLRAIVMHLDRLTAEQVTGLEVPTAVPIVYELDPALRVVSKKAL
jgi:2,3-bisphosphoglycerate-dependent phosphoglycerate mutase